MAKKILYTIFISVAILFTGTICFASNESEKVETTNLGNEITSSIKNTEKSMDNLVETNSSNDNGRSMDRKSGDNSGNSKIGNDVRNGVNDLENGARDITEDGENRTNTATAGTTGNYTSGDTLSNNSNTGMNTSTWVWIIVAVIAIIIIAALWYYVSQK